MGSANQAIVGRDSPPEFEWLNGVEKVFVPVAMPGDVAPQVKAPGTSVAVAEPLTVGGGEGFVPLAPVAGRIVGVGESWLTAGQRVWAVEIAAEASATESVHSSKEPEAVGGGIVEVLQEMRAAELGEWIDRLRGMGVWAARHSGPDVITQLNQVLRRPVDTVLCNALDSDPTARVQGATAVREAENVVAAVAGLAKLCGARQAWIIADAGAPLAWAESLRKAARDVGVRFLAVRNDYPLSDPTMLLFTLFGRKLRPGRLPVEQGVLLVDAVGAAAVGHAMTGRPMLRTPIVLRDHGRRKSRFAWAPIGAPVKWVLKQLGVNDEHRGDATIRAGDVLRDVHVPDEAVVGGSETILHATYHHTPENPDPCVRCGWCVEGCPTRINPAGLLDASQRGDMRLGEHYGLDACIECGICTYVCASRLPLLVGIRKLKAIRAKTWAPGASGEG